jgi:hypothetical protein
MAAIGIDGSLMDVDKSSMDINESDDELLVDVFNVFLLRFANLSALADRCLSRSSLLKTFPSAACDVRDVLELFQNSGVNFLFGQETTFSFILNDSDDRW